VSSMKATIYELVQKRAQLIKELEELREERKERATERVRIEEKGSVKPTKLEDYAPKVRALMQHLLAVTVALRKKNVMVKIPGIEVTPEEARIHRDMLDKEIHALRELKDSRESLYSDGRDTVRVSCINRDELNALVKRLTEERGRLDTALQKFNLSEEVEVGI